MDFIDRIRELASRIPRQINDIQTEEATKTAFVMPFISALGYDVFDPAEVVPEFVADVGTKKGEKVDFAILRDGKPILLFECKKAGVDLDTAHASQLYRYFTTTEGRFAVLTNGVVYRFFSDLDKANRMDSRPFLEIDLADLKEPLVEELKRFSKTTFDEESILATASTLKYTSQIKRIVGEQWKEPSEELVRLLAGQVYSGRFTQAVKEQFTSIVRTALQEFLSDRIKDRLESALAGDVAAPAAPESSEVPETAGEGADGIETTEEEIEAFYMVKAILREVTDTKRVFLRDAKSYCSVILDDNNRKPICRLHFNGPRKVLGLFDEEKKESRVALDSLDDIFRYASQLAATVYHYEK